MRRLKTVKSLKVILFLAFFLTSANFQECGAEMVRFYENGPLHDALVTRTSGNTVLFAISSEPPSPINEKTPRQLDMQAEWIPGYWDWDVKNSDFVWVSGMWRRPPPGHQWIEGFWKKYEDGWVRFSGFWSRLPLQSLTAIGKAPPEPLDQNTAPAPSDQFFWMPGYWHFLFDEQEYRWVKGEWEELDTDWVFVPAHYRWRPGGYIFVPPYWDWKLEDRGTAYAPVFIGEAYRNRVAYEPAMVLKPEMIVRNLYPSYPDYLAFFQHHWHANKEFWSQCCAPPWWEWDTWWSFPPKDQWSLWWWYTHPGYPQPAWMTPELSGIIPPPLTELIVMQKQSLQPVAVTSQGVVSSNDILRGISKSTGNFTPILPAQKTAVERIKKIAARKTDKPQEVLMPLGRRLPLNPSTVRPNVRKPVLSNHVSLKAALVSDDKKPAAPIKPKIPTHKRPPIWNPHAEARQPSQFMPKVRRPSWSPRPGSQNSSSQSGYSGSVNRQNGEQGRSHHDSSSNLSQWRPMRPYENRKISRPPIHKPSMDERLDNAPASEKSRSKFHFPQREGSEAEK